jgi:hypothetical protein
VTRVEQLVAAAQDGRRIGAPEDGRAIARLIFAVYQAEIRRWLLEPDPRPKKGLDALRRALDLVIRGLEPRDRS